jgi:carbon monoxide dehydrogenase subunit G
MASEKFDRSTTVPADAATTWAALTDVDTLASWVGILHDVKEIERLDTYTAVLEDRVGPFKLRADLAVDVKVPEEGVRVEVSASGRDRAVDSKIAINASLSLAADTTGGGGTTIHLEGTYQVTGRVASMGGGIIRKKGDGVLDDFFTNAERKLG